jgi:hypothetical protein
MSIFILRYEAAFKGILCASILLLVALAISQWFIYRQAEQNFQRVVPYMTKTQVLALMGPNETVGPGSGDFFLYWDEHVFRDKPVRCLEEYYFAAPGPWPEYWVIGFDESNRAVRHWHIVEL